MQFLKQSTAIDVRVGPFVDSTDGVTPETTVALGTADQAEALKNNGAATVSIASNTWAAVTGADGWYDLTLSTTDTNTVGLLDIVVQDSSLCLPVFARFMVVEEAIFDALFGSAATGFDANGRVDVGAVLGTAQTAGNLTSLITTVDTVVDGIQTDLDNGTDGLGAIKTAVDAIPDQVWDELQSAHVTAGSFGEIATEVASILTDTNELQTNQGNWLTATGFATSAALSTVDTVVDGIQADLDNATDGLGAIKTAVDANQTDLTNIETDTQNIQSRLPAALVGGRMDSNTSAISGDSAAADNLEASMETLVTGTASGGTTSTVTSGVTGHGDDTFIGRVLMFRTGTLQYEAGVITDYNSATGEFTFAASTWTTSPTTETFVIV